MAWQLDDKARGAALVWAAVVIMAAANSVVGVLTEWGARHPLDGRNPITPCNVLLVGSFCAFVVLALIHRRDWTRATLRTLGRADWLAMIVSALFSSALAPAFTLLALEHTTVTNLVLVGRLEPFVFLLVSAVVLGERLDRWTVAGATVTLLGVGLAFALENRGGAGRLGMGELYAALAAISLAGSTVVSKSGLQRIPLGIFTVFRTGLAVVVFFCTAVCLYGFAHFHGVRSPFLWQAMAVYGAVFVVGAQLCWFCGLRSARSGDVALAGAFSPIAAILFALLIHGERPSPALAAGGAMIVTGIVIGQLGARTFAALRTLRAAWITVRARWWRPDAGETIETLLRPAALSS